MGRRYFLCWRTWLSGLLLAPLAAFALQMKALEEGQTARFDVSEGQLNRVFIMGDRIVSVRGTEGEYHLTKDETTGSVYLLPLPGHGKKINVFLTTEKGRDYLLVLLPKAIGAQTIGVRPVGTRPPAGETGPLAKDTPYLENLVTLMASMANGTVPEGYVFVPVTNKGLYTLRNGLKYQRMAVYWGEKWSGEIWRVQNAICHARQLDEQEFYTPSTLAVALKDQTLKNCGETRLYRALSNGER